MKICNSLAYKMCIRDRCYADNFDSFKSVFDELNKDDASSTDIIQNLLKNSNVRNELVHKIQNLYLKKPLGLRL